MKEMKFKKHRVIRIIIALMAIASMNAISVKASDYKVSTVSTDTVTTQTYERISGQNRYETAVMISRTGWVSSDFAVLSAGMDGNLVDALTAAPLAKLKNAPLLLTQGTSLNSQTEAELIRLGVRTVYVTSGTGVIQQPVLDKLRSMGLNVEPLGGKNRYETSVNIARQIGASAKVIIATGASNADALSIAPIAAAYQYPILLSEKDALPASVADYISSIRTNIADSYIIGGTGVLSDNVLYDMPVPQRLGGTDRYQTNRVISDHFYGYFNFDKTYLVNGENAHLVDALAAAPLIAMTSSPMIMTPKDMPDETINYITQHFATNMSVIGGEAVVPYSGVQEITEQIVYSKQTDTIGPTNGNSKIEYDNNVRMTEKEITLQNAKVNKSVYINGDNCQLNNVDVSGTIFLNPGQNNKVTLNNVTAENIVIITGSNDNSIDLNTVSCQKILLSNQQQVRLKLAGSCQIGSTLIHGDTIYELISGDTGSIQVIPDPNKEVVLNLNGEFTKTITVNGTATLRNTGAKIISNIDFYPLKSIDRVMLDGNFETVNQINKGIVQVLDNSVINKLNVQNDSEIYVSTNGIIKMLSNNSLKQVFASGGGVINGNRISVDREQLTSQPDTIPPNFMYGYPSVWVTNSTDLSIEFKITELGTVYYIVLGDNSAEPSVQQVIQGKYVNNTVIPDFAKGKITVNPDTQQIVRIDKLDPATAYDIYFVVEDMAGNVLDTVKKLDVETR
ncbi:MAG: N-acetylmuramoyl-L-alanine amidase LytC [Candidatus Dichloromethanomonas elyunquensis]|nr:MAG: N-acetylmuramoyl-L-alanine amidase LytC [Candidatus Dichloromethanomonas elyunquensis]